MISGYYHFLGKGDMHPDHALSGWGLPEWESWMDRLRELGHSRLWLLANGHTLAYPSRAEPGLIDPHAVCARDLGLVRAIVNAGKERGFRMLAVVTTDGHALEFAMRHPELVSLDREGKPVGEDTLCLEEPEVVRYLERTFGEIMELASWDGVVFHPTEANPLRFNAATRDFFRRESGRDLATESDEALMAWCNRRFAWQAAEWMDLWRRRLPGCDLVMFNCWWTNDHIDAYRELLPSDSRVCVWDYDYKSPEMRDRPLNRWVAALGSARVVFMPSSGGYPEFGRPPGPEALAGYRRLAGLAGELGVPEIVLFAGWGAGGDKDLLDDRALLAAVSGNIGDKGRS